MPKKKTKKFKNTEKKKIALPTKKNGAGKRIIYPIAIVVITLSLIFTIYTISTAARPLSVKETKACRVDNDCIEVPADCCGCANGGKSQAINRKYKGYVAEKRVKECRNYACLAVYVCDEEVKPRCGSGQGVIKSDKPPR